MQNKIALFDEQKPYGQFSRPNEKSEKVVSWIKNKAKTASWMEHKMREVL